MSAKIPDSSRFLVIERQEIKSRSLPPGTRLVAEGESLEDLIEPLEIKTGARYRRRSD